MMRCRIEVQKMMLIWWHAQVLVGGQVRSPRFWSRTSEGAESQAEAWAIAKFAEGHDHTTLGGETIGDPDNYAYYLDLSRVFNHDAEGEALVAPGDMA